MKIAIGSDHAGYILKAHLMEHLEKKGIAYENLGGFAPESIDYPVAAERVAEAVKAGRFDLGVLVCGSGIGVAIAANKVRGIRAAVCSEPYSAKMAREHNNANILTMGERVVGPDLATMILDAFLSAQFEGGRHARRVDLISDMETRG